MKPGLLHSFFTFAMQSRTNAILVAVVFSFLKFFSWLAVIIIALVTLRKGAKEGAIIVSVVLGLLLALLGRSDASFWLYFETICTFSSVYLLALVLRNTANWRFVIKLATVLGGVFILAIYAHNPEIGSEYLANLTDFVNRLQQEGAKGTELKQLLATIQAVSPYIVGIQLSLFLLGQFVFLGLARSLQSLLYNPGGSRNELLSIRLDSLFVLLLAFCSLGMFFDLSAAYPLLPVFILPFVLAGVSLAHALVKNHPGRGFKLVIFYLFIFLALPVSLVPVIALSFIDIWADFRKLAKN